MFAPRYLFYGSCVIGFLLWIFITINENTNATLNHYGFESSTQEYYTVKDEENIVSKNENKTVPNPFDQCILPQFDPWDEEIVPCRAFKVDRKISERYTRRDLLLLVNVAITNTSSTSFFYQFFWFLVFKFKQQFDTEHSRKRTLMRVVQFVDQDYDPLQNCDRSFVPMTKLKNGILKTTVQNVTCWGRCLTRKNELRNVIGRWMKANKTNFRCDVIESLCTDRNGTDVYQMVHAQIVEKGTKDEYKRKENQYDVYVILLDSIAATQATRSLPRTLQFFEKSMQAVSFPHVNKVGLNSRPNGVALWFGKQMEKIDRTLFGLPPVNPDWTSETFCSRYMDNETFLLKEFSEKGYKTLLAEDWMQGTLNWPNCWGFKAQPTDHYMRLYKNDLLDELIRNESNSIYFRPFQVAIERNATKLLKETYNIANCVEQHKDILRYLQDFMHSYKAQPKIGWIWLTMLGHDSEDGVTHADSDFQRFLLNNKRKLDNSFVIFLGDHGLRGGKVTRTKLGNIEMSNPFFSISIPKKLRQSTTILETLRENAARLQTHYDIRATFLDILKASFWFFVNNYIEVTDRSFKQIEGEYGTSLLRSQTAVERTCKNLPIPLQYCTCQYPMQTIKRSLPFATKAGRFLMDYVNSVLADNNVSSLCSTLKYQNTMKISAYIPEEVSKSYEIVVKAQPPSNGEFKAIVRTTENGFEIASTSIERLDRFGNRGKCVDDWFKHLCHCITNPNTSKHQQNLSKNRRSFSIKPIRMQRPTRSSFYTVNSEKTNILS
ncbi:hypothetical protein DICVIV_10842 [Dictyocaulus viviparus]|uniref:Uncharacterized protein n=1 Tax=Dictyocaulus viviparus TaxID=29172 RepID=A0A0D8XEX3_DICVI|nr:hypothetical protein DICVIV_10842 [Dictyocaulus viviparus]